VSSSAECADEAVVVSSPLLSGYTEKKITENIDAEIAQVCLDEATSSWPAQMVIELQSENAEQLESNAQRTLQWVENHCKQNGIAFP